MRAARQTRYRLLMTGLTAALLAAMVGAAMVGAAGLRPAQVLQATLSLIAPSWADPAAYPAWAPKLLLDLRFPRLVMALIAGAALSSAGATFQGVFRNPLAEPYLLGISAGAGVGATIAIIWKPLTALSIYSLPLLAFVGALFAAFLVYRLATFSGQTSGGSLLLSGVAVGSTFTAVMSAMMIATEPDMHTVFVWLMGGLTTSTWSKVAVAGPVVVAGFLYMLFMARRMNLLLMGEERAWELGVDAGRTRRNLLIVASLTTAAAVSFTGLIGFVGLMVPHMIRLIIGPDHRHLLPATAIFGALFLLVADTVARTAFAPSETPVGIITAFVGGPFFLYLLRTRRGV